MGAEYNEFTYYRFLINLFIATTPVFLTLPSLASGPGLTLPWRRAASGPGPTFIFSAWPVAFLKKARSGFSFLSPGSVRSFILP
jgi:hypothetical protein